MCWFSTIIQHSFNNLLDRYFVLSVDQTVGFIFCITSAIYIYLLILSTRFDHFSDKCLQQKYFHYLYSVILIFITSL